MGVVVSTVSQFPDVGFDFVPYVGWRINLVEHLQDFDMKSAVT